MTDQGHIFQFTDEATAQTALPGLYRASSGTPDTDSYDAGGWDTSVVIAPGMEVYKVTGTEQETDTFSGATVTVETRNYATGWFIRIASSVDTTGLTPFDATGYTVSPVFAE